MNEKEKDLKFLKYKKEIFSNLENILKKMIEIEKEEKQNVFTDEAYLMLSYTMEHVTGVIGNTDKTLAEFGMILKNKSN